MRHKAKPLIGISTCGHVFADDGLFFKAGVKYVEAVAECCDAIPVLIPSLGAMADCDGMLERLDGILLTGSPSNVEPHHYGSESRDGVLHDPERDATTLPLIRRALALGTPLLAICRGHQELNVALGGSLHQHVQELSGKRDHRAPRDVADWDEKYHAAHEVELRPGGMLARLAGGAGRATVNSLHQQAINRLGDGLQVEAESDDGVIEAVSYPAAAGFVLGVQWHPEHPHARQWDLSRALFAAFGDAARQAAAALPMRQSA